MMIDRIRLFLRRHGPTLAILALVVLVVHGVASTLRPAPDDVFAGRAEGPFPLLHVADTMAAALPRMGVSGEHVFRMLLAALAGGMAMLGVWRLTGNRVVSLAAGILLGSHPATLWAAGTQAGLADLMTLLVAAAAFCFHAKPKRRSSRFPNRPPTPLSIPVLGVMFVGILAAPGAWVIPALLVVQDRVFDRDRGLRSIDWRGYGPYFACGVVQLVLILVFANSNGTAGRSDAPVIEAFFDRLVAAITIRRADDMGLVPRLVILGAMALSLAACWLDVKRNVGSRRRLVRYFGFAGVWLFISAASGAIAPGGMLYGNLLVGLLGLALFVPAVFWRVAVFLVPPSESVPVMAPPSWDAVHAGLTLATVPAIDDLPPPRVDRNPPRRAPVRPRRERGATLSPELREALEGLEGDPTDSRVVRAQVSPLPMNLIDERVLPLVPKDAHVLDVTSGRGALTARLALRARSVTVWMLDDAGRHGYLGSLDNIPGVRALNGGERTDLNSGTIDFASAIGVFRSMTSSRQKSLLRELARILIPGAPCVFTVADLEGEHEGEVHAMTADGVRLLLDQTGFDLESIDGTHGELLVVGRVRGEA